MNPRCYIFDLRLREQSNEQQLATMSRELSIERSAGVRIKVVDLIITP